MVVRGDFNPQNIANTLWAFAMLGLQPRKELIAGMMKQAVAVRGDFIPQNIASTLWAFTTLGPQPSQELSGDDVASCGGAKRVQRPGDFQHAVGIRDAGTAA